MKIDVNGVIQEATEKMMRELDDLAAILPAPAPDLKERTEKLEAAFNGLKKLVDKLL